MFQNTCPISRLCQHYHDMIGFKGMEFLAIRPATQAGGPFLLAILNCLFTILAATSHIYRPSSHSVTRGCGMP